MFKGAINFTANLLEKPIKKDSVIENRYEIMDVLGRGSYGTSYLVFDRKDKTSVVLKMLRIHKRILKSGKRAFEQEQKLLQSLHCSYFPVFYEKGDMNGVPFFTMEYVRGSTFEQLIFEEAKTYTEKDSFQVGYQLLEIIHWLHSRGIVHRDIRIPNVMLSHDQIRLIDFGLARPFNQKSLPQINLDDIRKTVAPVSDFFALGHFLLFLLYSSFEYKEESPERSWEEELSLTPWARLCIRKLLAIDEPYHSCMEIKQDFHRLLTL